MFGKYVVAREVPIGIAEHRLETRDETLRLLAKVACRCCSVLSSHNVLQVGSESDRFHPIGWGRVERLGPKGPSTFSTLTPGVEMVVSTQFNLFNPVTACPLDNEREPANGRSEIPG